MAIYLKLHTGDKLVITLLVSMIKFLLNLVAVCAQYTSVFVTKLFY